MISRICLGDPPTRLPQEQPSPGSSYPSASPLRCPSTELVGSPRRGSLSTSDSGLARMRWYWNINQSSIGYASRPRLRSRLTLSRRTLLRNPWAIGGGDSHPSFVTHASILTSHASTAGLRRRFAGMGTLPYHSLLAQESVASALDLSPVTLSALDHLTSALLRSL